jgi:mRNA interferase MazF
MASKDYRRWHAKKTALNGSRGGYYFYEREIWWMAIGHNIGDEEDGKGHDFARPVLIMRKFNKSLFYGLPLSATVKSGKYYYKLTVRGRKNVVMLSHLRDYDAKRLLDKWAIIDEDEYARIQLALILVLKQPSQPGAKIYTPARRRG